MLSTCAQAFALELQALSVLPGPARAALLEQHADLFHPDFWRSVQRKLRVGEILEVFPYRPERRLVIAN